MASDRKTQVQLPTLSTIPWLYWTIFACAVAEVAMSAVAANMSGVFGWGCALAWMSYSRFVENHFNRFVRDLCGMIDAMKEEAKDNGK